MKTSIINVFLWTLWTIAFLLCIYEIVDRATNKINLERKVHAEPIEGEKEFHYIPNLPGYPGYESPRRLTDDDPE
jgi:hypothetical protein